MAPTAELMEKLLRRRRQLAESLPDQDVTLDENDSYLGHCASREGSSREALLTAERRAGATFGAASPSSLPAHRCASWEAASAKRRQPLQAVENLSSEGGAKDEPRTCPWVSEDYRPEGADKPSMTPALAREKKIPQIPAQERCHGTGAAHLGGGNCKACALCIDGGSNASASMKNAQSPQIALDLPADDKEEMTPLAEQTYDVAQQDFKRQLGEDGLHAKVDWSTTSWEPIEDLTLNHLHNTPEGLAADEALERAVHQAGLCFELATGIVPDDEVGGGLVDNETPMEPVSAEPGFVKGSLSEVARRLLHARSASAAPEVQVHEVAEERVRGLTQRLGLAEQATSLNMVRQRIQAAAELRAAQAQVVELEAVSRAATARRRERNAIRKALARQAEVLRYELMAHRERASRKCAIERRIQELQHELLDTRAELREATLLRS